jgi:hypothetical protein
MTYIRRSKFERLTLKRKLVSIMGGCCVDCGYSSHLAALDFDHRDPSTKKFQLAKGLTHYSELLCEIEAAKCDIRCANCHRIKTHPDAT